MNSLEFINKEIEQTQTSYEAFELDYELFHRESDKRDTEKLIQKLIHLKQIKAELEAWKVVKHKLRKSTFIIMDSIPITHPGYRTIEKVLEVSNVKDKR